MSTELSRRTFVIPDTGEPVFLIEQGRAGSDDAADDFNRYKVIKAGSTVRSDIRSESAALALVEGLGATEQVAGDERTLAAELNFGSSVFQAAMAPLISDLAARINDGYADLDRKVAANQPLTDDEAALHAKVSSVVGEGTRVPDSQATGTMEITTGLGGVRRHGLGERFEGAADHAEELAAGALTADGATEDDERGKRPRSSATAAKGKEPAEKAKGPSKVDAKANDTPEKASGTATPASATSNQP